MNTPRTKPAKPVTELEVFTLIERLESTKSKLYQLRKDHRDMVSLNASQTLAAKECQKEVSQLRLEVTRLKEKLRIARAQVIFSGSQYKAMFYALIHDLQTDVERKKLLTDETLTKWGIASIAKDEVKLLDNTLSPIFTLSELMDNAPSQPTPPPVQPPVTPSNSPKIQRTESVITLEPVNPPPLALDDDSVGFINMDLPSDSEVISISSSPVKSKPTTPIRKSKVAKMRVSSSPRRTLLIGLTEEELIEEGYKPVTEEKKEELKKKKTTPKKNKKKDEEKKDEESFEFSSDPDEEMPCAQPNNLIEDVEFKEREEWTTEEIEDQQWRLSLRQKDDKGDWVVKVPNEVLYLINKKYHGGNIRNIEVRNKLADLTYLNLDEMEFIHDLRVRHELFEIQQEANRRRAANKKEAEKKASETKANALSQFFNKK